MRPARTVQKVAPSAGESVPQKEPSSDALSILHEKLYKGKPARQRGLERERENAEIARMIYTLRTEADLTQAQLASKIGTTGSVICRLEDADYEGHSLSLLRRIAAALGRRVRVELVPLEETGS